MTDQPNQELPPAKRRRLIFRAVLRGLLTTTVLVVLYYLLPLDQPWDTGTAVRLVIGLLAFVGVTVWQVRAITGSRYLWGARIVSLDVNGAFRQLARIC